MIDADRRFCTGALALSIAAVLSGCQQRELIIPKVPGLEPYRMTIQQGNYISQEMVAQLKVGMTREQVRFVLGTPLPSLPGRACVEDAGIVVPAGFAWTPAVSARVVRRALFATDETIVLWEEDGVRLLDAELFVPASRAAAHATASSP